MEIEVKPGKAAIVSPYPASQGDALRNRASICERWFWGNSPLVGLSSSISKSDFLLDFTGAEPWLVLLNSVTWQLLCQVEATTVGSWSRDSIHGL